MPTIFIEGYRFRFYSSDMNEPPHVHILRGGNQANVRLQPVLVQANYGYNQAELNRIVKLTIENQAQLLEAWYEYFKR